VAVACPDLGRKLNFFATFGVASAVGTRCNAGHGFSTHSLWVSCAVVLGDSSARRSDSCTAVLCDPPISRQLCTPGRPSPTQDFLCAQKTFRFPKDLHHNRPPYDGRRIPLVFSANHSVGYLRKPPTQGTRSSVQSRCGAKSRIVQEFSFFQQETVAIFSHIFLGQCW